MHSRSLIRTIWKLSAVFNCTVFVLCTDPEPASLSVSRVVWPEKWSLHWARRSRFRWFEDSAELNIRKAVTVCLVWPGPADRSEFLAPLSRHLISSSGFSQGHVSWWEVNMTSLSLYMKLEMCKNVSIQTVQWWGVSQMSGLWGDVEELGPSLCPVVSSCAHLNLFSALGNRLKCFFHFWLHACFHCYFPLPSLKDIGGEGAIWTLVHFITSLLSVFLSWLSLSVHFSVDS